MYVKRQEDYAKTRAVCEQYVGDLPTIYAVADVCRPELLVEVEAVAFSCKAAPPQAADAPPFESRRANPVNVG